MLEDVPPPTKLAVVIDDDRMVAETTANVVALAGIRAVGLSSVVSPDDVFFDPAPDLCLIDLMLQGEGGRDGIELMRALKAAGWRCPFIAFSASDQMLDLARECGGFVACVGKPYEMLALVTVIQKALGAES